MMLPTLMLAVAVLTVQTAVLQPASPAPADAATPPAIQPATQPTGEATTLAKDASVEVLLAALHQRGLNLQGFAADVTLTDIDQGNGATTTYTGKLLHDAVGGSIRVDFATRAEDDKPAKPYRNLYALTGGWLTDRDYKRKKEQRLQVLQPGQKLNLLKLGEGPFPLPIGQDPAEVLKQFDVEKLDSDDPRPALRLVPKANTRLASKFKQIDVWIDPASHFPTQIETLDPNQTKQRGTELQNLVVNPQPPLSEKDFALEPVPAGPDGWEKSERPYED